MNVIGSKKMFHSRKSLHGHEAITFDTQVYTNYVGMFLESCL